MGKKSSGFIQLEWKCPGCEARNPGPEETCLSCGAPQPDDVEFVAPAERKFVTDEKKLARAKSGADIYCAFCETRNPATEETCIQCGADLAEGKRRKSGGGVKRREAEKIIRCPSCDSENSSSNATCQACGATMQKEPVTAAQFDANKKAPDVAQEKKPKRAWIIGLVLALALCCVAGLLFFFAPSEDVRGTVSDVRWETNVPVQEEREVDYSNELGNPPADAYDVSCHTETEEVCTEETVDQGNGFAEVVENCETHSQEYCSYSILEWQTIETLTLSGDDLDPQYANPSLQSGQRLGTENVDYTVTFSADSDTLTYNPGSLSEYQQFQPGSEWTLTLNRLGGIVSVER